MSPNPEQISLDPNEHSDAQNADQTKRFRERDEVFWTELEIRRLGNMVAECIHARRYVGDGTEADEERKTMRRYIEAMKRKSMRVLHRAELYARSGHASWPGIDPTITDPVSLAEEYVRVVENYEAVLGDEEARAKKLKDAKGDIGVTSLGSAAGGPLTQLPTAEDWEAADTAAFKEAVKREKELTKSAEEARKDLLSQGEGVRHRRGSAGPSETATYSKEDEELMSKHQPIQDELTSNLVDLVGQLKESITENKEKIERDNKILDETEEAVDKNLSGVSKQRGQLKKFTQSTSVSWWLMMVAAVVILVIFALVLVLLQIPI